MPPGPQFVPREQIDSLILDKAYFLEPSGKSAKSYVLLRRTLVESYSEDFDPERFTDEYQQQLIEEKLEHGEDIDTEATFGEADESEDGEGDIVDLIEALTKSVDERRGQRGTSGAGQSASGNSGGRASRSSSTRRAG